MGVRRRIAARALPLGTMHWPSCEVAALSSMSRSTIRQSIDDHKFTVIDAVTSVTYGNFPHPPAAQEVTHALCRRVWPCKRAPKVAREPRMMSEPRANRYRAGNGRPAHGSREQERRPSARTRILPITDEGVCLNTTTPALPLRVPFGARHPTPRHLRSRYASATPAVPC